MQNSTVKSQDCEKSRQQQFQLITELRSRQRAHLETLTHIKEEVEELRTTRGKSYTKGGFESLISSRLCWTCTNKIQGVSFDLVRWVSNGCYLAKRGALSCETEENFALKDRPPCIIGSLFSETVFR